MRKKVFTCSCGTQISITRCDDDGKAAAHTLEKAVSEHIQEKHKRHLTPVAADECHSCGATGMFSDGVCIECGTRR